MHERFARRKKRTHTGPLGRPCRRAHRRHGRELACAHHGADNVMSADPIANALTIDVEDYFQVSAFAATIARCRWPSMPCRVEANVDTILSLLARRKIRATFFTLGWIARRYPAMIARIVAQGHEL